MKQVSQATSSPRSHLPQPLFFLALLFAVVLLNLTTVRPAQARPVRQASAFTVTVTADRLNVRSGPGTDNAVVAKLVAGTQVQVNGANADESWYRVTLSDGTSGWIVATYATRDDGTTPLAGGLIAIGTVTDSSAPVATGNDRLEQSAAAATEPTATEPTATEPTAYTNPAQMNIRRGPGTNYAIASSVPAGTALPILGRNAAGDWYQVRLSGEAEPVWVYGALIRVVGAVDGVPTLSAEEVPAAPVAAAPAATTSAAPAASAPPPAGAGFFGYGIQVNAWQGDKGGSAAMANDIGFPWVKQQVRWEFVENEPGAVNWTEMDQIIDVMRGNNLNVLFSVVTAPQWTRPDKPGTGGPPNDFNAYANFVGQIAGRFCGRLGAIEVWNEQNLQREWEGFPLDAGLYMDLLRRSYVAIKGACPSMLVISGATTPTGDSPVAIDDITYLRQMYANGLANYSDGIGIHPSGYGNPPSVTIQDWQAGSYNAPSHVNHRSFYFRSTMEESRAVMIQYGDANKRLWPTEFGWASSQSPHPGYEYSAYNSPAQQAQYTVEAYTMMRNWGWVGVAFLWNLNYNYGEMAQWSIVGKPAYEALKGMGK